MILFSHIHFLFYLIAFVWALFTGFIFSTIGAAGGIFASFGFITILHVKDANSIKVMSQILTIVTPLIAVPLFIRQKRVSLILGAIIASGGIVGAILGSWFSKHYLYELKSFKYFFGYLTLFIAILLIYKVILKKRKQKLNPSAQNLKLEDNVIKTLEVNFRNVKIRYFNQEYNFNPIFAFIAGMFIAIISSIFGVGGGFLLVPFMTGILNLPMMIVAGTSVFSILISSSTSVTNYISMGVHVLPFLLLISVAGIIAGSFLGPVVSKSKYIKEEYLNYMLIAVLIFIGIFYIF
ncbi:MAG: sulfite exporter TauE/SafE family protein [bacterium]